LKEWHPLVIVVFVGDVKIEIGEVSRIDVVVKDSKRAPEPPADDQRF
jgi:hypothetical protein